MSGIRYDGNITTAAQNVPLGAAAPMYTMPYAQVTVYEYGTPPLTLATLFADGALTEPILNPIATDSQGRFGFWIAAGVYSCTAKSANGVLIGNFNLTLTAPQGPVGTPATVAIGTVNTGAPGSQASVSNSGTESAAVFNFAMPQGPVGPTGAQGPTGATGAPGANGVASMAQLASLRVNEPTLQNFYNPANAVANSFVSHVDGTINTLANFTATGFIVANAGGSMTSSLPLANNGNAGVAFYDGNLTFISGLSPTTTTFSVPATAAYIRLTWQTSVLAAAVGLVMVVAGTVLPSPAIAFGTYATNIIDSKDLMTVAQAQAAVAAGQPLVINLFDLNRITVGAYNTLTNAIDPTQTTLYVSGNMPVVGGQTYTMAKGTGGASNSSFGGAWLDAAKNVISTFATPETDGENFTAPAKAVYFLFTGVLASSEGGPAVQMFTAGTTVPSPYIPFGRSTPTPTAATYSTGNGKNIGVLGDSFSAWFNNEWQNIVLARTGANLTFQDSRGGRQWTQALECYGTVTPGAALSTYSTTYPIIDQTNFAFNLTGRAPQISTLGNTLAQNLATTELLIIELGENDSTYAVGAPSDPTKAGTLWGNMRWVVEAYLTAKPTLRIVMIGNTYRGDGPTLAAQQAVAAAEKAFAQSYAIPYLDLFNVGGNSLFTNTAYTRTDFIHPNDFNFQNVYAPAVANFIEQWL
jgi:hypothetical protein